MNSQTLAERFWQRVTKSDGCWTWTGAVGQDGYGKYKRHDTNPPVHARAHRLAWELTYGPPPAELNVLHSCDNPRCVRPCHLFLGTHADNVADKTAKVRQAKWERHGSAKLDWTAVQQIREARKQGVFLRVLAARFGVSIACIGYISLGQHWRSYNKPDPHTARGS